jgi:tetratricopeptide (TPR) repeat protein
MIKKVSIVSMIFVVFCFFMQGSFIEAQEKAAKKEIPKKVLKLLKKANKASKEKNYEKAMEFFNKAKEVNPQVAQIYIDLAFSYVEQGKPEEALKEFEQAIKVDPNNPVAMEKKSILLYNLANQEIQKRQLNKAGEYYDKLLAIPNIDTVNRKIYIKTLYQAGMISNNIKQSKKSIELFEKFIAIPGIETELANEFKISHYLLGIILSQEKSFEKSNQYLKKYLDLTKDNPTDKWAGLATGIIGANYFDLMETETKKFEKTELEKIAAKAKEFKDTETYLLKALSMEIPEALVEQAYLKLGNYYYYCRDLEKTVKTYKTLIEKFASSSNVSSYKDFLKKIEDTIAKQKKK